MYNIDSNGRVGRYHVARDFARIRELGAVQFFQPSDDGAMRAKVGHQDVGLLVASDQEITAPAIRVFRAPCIGVEKFVTIALRVPH